MGHFETDSKLNRLESLDFLADIILFKRGLHWFQVNFRDRRKGSLSSRRHIKPGASHWDAFSCTTSAERQTMSQKKSNTAVLHCHSQHGQHAASAFQRPESPGKSRKTVTVDIKKGPLPERHGTPDDGHLRMDLILRWLLPIPRSDPSGWILLPRKSRWP